MITLIDLLWLLFIFFLAIALDKALSAAENSLNERDDA